MVELSIRTERLSLRPFAVGDAPRVRELIGAWAVARNLARIPYPYPQGLAEEWISKHDDGRMAGAHYPFAITLHNRLIGGVGLHENAERGQITLGYWIAVAYWGFGYATEAARAILGFGFGWLGLAGVGAQHYRENEMSGRVLRKLGFVETGRGLHPCLARKAEIPGVELELTRDEWLVKRV
ncbi:MAG: GNAT family N-acetyltransferase [Rhodospirillaceae bacterium]